jgi:membrane protease YdiL (CAAX protease family)
MIPIIFRYVRPLIAIAVVLLSFAFLFYICVYPVPEQNKDMIQLAAGLDLAVLGTIIAYYFGNSKDKSDQEQAARQPDTTTITQTTKP